jgi:hypothetical protein
MAPEAGIVLPLLDSTRRKISQLEEAIGSCLEEEGRALAQATTFSCASGAVTPASPWSLWCKGLSKGLWRLPGMALRMLHAS